MSTHLKFGINGFGRIGRVITRLVLDRDDIELVGINDLCRPEQMVHLLKYDSVHGPLEYGRGRKMEVRLENDTLVVSRENKRELRIRLSAERDPYKIAWGALSARYVHECTGVFTEREKCSGHLSAGAKRVIVSAPSKDADLTVCMGVNENLYDPARHTVISNASCTTNCLAPLCKVLDEQFGLVRGTMMTVHSVTNDQNVLDYPHRDLRRARAAGLSMIPTTTGATRALAAVMPHLKGRIEGTSIRVPTPNVSIVDFTCELGKNASKEEINEAFRKASQTTMKGILGYSTEPLVSIDYNGCESSATIDAEQTIVLGGNFVKVLSWYDNETGFSARMLDLTHFMARKEI